MYEIRKIPATESVIRRAFKTAPDDAASRGGFWAVGTGYYQDWGRKDTHNLSGASFGFICAQRRHCLLALRHRSRESLTFEPTEHQQSMKMAAPGICPAAVSDG